MRQKLIGILAVRDEVDIIRPALERFLEWMDHLLVLDTGSIDGTLKAVVEAAAQDTRIIPIANTPRIFTVDLRGYLHFHLQGLARKGDWIARVDADEIYKVDPRDFLLTHGQGCDHLFARYYTFQPFLDDTRDWIERLRGTKEPLESMRWPLPRTYYFHQSELRLYRYKAARQWPGGRGQPINLVNPVPVHLPVLHYPARNPLQLAERQALRNLTATSAIFRKSYPNADKHHWTQAWTSYLITNPLWSRFEGEAEPAYTHPDPVVRSPIRSLRNRAKGIKDRPRASVYATSLLTPFFRQYTSFNCARPMPN